MIGSFRELLRFIRSRDPYIDESVFRLHCLYTTMILLFFFIVITTKQIAGEPIDCDTNRGGVKESVLNTYCLIHNTYLIRSAFNERIGLDVAHPGVRDGQDEVEYRYYQWIWFVFFIEALFFYSPRWVWKNFECGTMSHLMSKDKTFIVKRLFKYRESNQSYGLKYLLCLVIAFVNVCLQIFAINFFFNDEFLTYGINVFNFLTEEPEKRRDALAMVFPRMAKCKFRKYGSSGSIQTLDALCVLPLNMYNEKIFIFLWYWFILVAVLLFATIVVKFILLVSPVIRYHYIRKMFSVTTIWQGRDATRTTLYKLSFGELILIILIKESKGLMFSKNVIQDLLRVYNMSESDRKRYFEKSEKESMDRESKNWESKDRNSLERVSMNSESKDWELKDKELPDKELKDRDSMEKELIAKDMKDKSDYV